MDISPSSQNEKIEKIIAILSLALTMDDRELIILTIENALEALKEID